MIGRPHICLRCQLRLGKRSALRCQAAFQSTNVRATPNLLQDHQQDQDQGESAPEWKPLPATERIYRELVTPAQAHGGNSSYTRRGVLKLDSRGREVPLSERAVGKLYGFRGMLKHESREGLNSSTFGRPAEVIVLRDSVVSAQSATARWINPKISQAIDIMATLDNQRGIVGQDTVVENINQLRPKLGSEPKNWEEFGALVQEVQSSFTARQLSRYIESFLEKKDGGEISGPAKPRLIPRITPWLPDTSNSKHPLEVSFRGYSVASYTAKQHLALRLIRECWNLGLPELEEGIGQLELELEPAEYDLLLKGKVSSLAAISSRHITNENESIEGFRSRHAVRITTTREKGDRIVQEIEQELRRVRKTELSFNDLLPAAQGRKRHLLKKWVDKSLDQLTLTELGLLTKTNIQKVAAKQLVISYIDDNPKSPVSSRADVARRLLLTSGELSDRTTFWLGCREAPGEADGAFIPYPVTEEFSWRDRLRQWTRWTVPVQKRDKSSKASDSRESTSQVQKQLTEDNFAGKATSVEAAVPEERGRDALAKPKGFVSWTDDYFMNSSCIMGSILHSHSSGGAPLSIRDLLANNPNLSAKVKQLFVTRVPNISRILSSKGSYGNKMTLVPERPTESLVLRFLPNPSYWDPKTSHSVGSQVLSAYPAVEMSFSVDRQTRVPTLKGVRATVSVNNSDLMLPDSSVDIRFRQQITSSLRVLYNRYPPGIVDFLENSNLELDFRKGRVETPPSLVIPIAKHLCRGPDFENSDDRNEMQDVEYLFAGLEIRNTLEMDYEGWRCQYTSIEAGRASGRRGELKLRPVRTTPQDSEVYSEEDFVAAAFSVAGSMDSGWMARRVETQKSARRILQSAGNSASTRRYFAKRVDIFYDEIRNEVEPEHEEE